MNKDLTSGKPETVLWQFVLPLFGSVLFQQLYNIADSLVAGRFIGEHALAAVGNSYEITMIFIAFAFGCNIGCSIVVSTFFGAKKYEEVRTTVSTAMIASGILCLLLMTSGLVFCRSLLRLIQTPQELIADSALYLRIYIWGLPFVFFYNISTGIFTALGDSRTPFLFLAASSCTNIAMDILFVAGFHMGVAGVAWATFICQGISCVLAVTVIMKRLRSMIEGPGTVLFSWPICLKIAQVAIPSTLQQSFVSVGNIVIQGVINGFGPGVMAGYSAAIKLNNLVITSFSTIGTGVSNYAAQNIGAGKWERVPQGYKAGLRLVWLFCVPIAVLYITCGKPLLLLFMKTPSDEALHTGMMLLRILSPFYFFVSAKIITDSILRGAGKMVSFMIATFTDLALRVILAFFLSRTGLGPTGIWCAWPIGWVIATGISVWFYRKEFVCSKQTG